MNARVGNLRGPLGLKRDQPQRKRRIKPGKSEAVRASAAGEPCALRLPCCLPGNDTVILAHIRMFGAAGMGEKPADYAALYACHACHDALDRRNAMTAGLWGFEDVLRALLETHRRLDAKGLLHMGELEP